MSHRILNVSISKVGSTAVSAPCAESALAQGCTALQGQKARKNPKVL